MPFGLFGKLPLKRDFIAYNLPRAILEPFESWLQTGIAASRLELGEDWLDRYLVAPIWRFQIGAGVLGAPVAGCLMPSVDGVGRYFPLALLHVGAPGEALSPPPFDPAASWYEAIEARMLGVLGDAAAIEPAVLVEGLPAPPPVTARPAPFPEIVRHGALWRSAAPAEDILAALVPAEAWIAAEDKSFWWTTSAERGSLAYVKAGLPQAGFLSDMIRGP